MKRIAIILLVLSLAGSSQALEPDIFGYFEPQLIGAEFNGEFVTLNSNKLRLDLEARPTKGVKFGANVNFTEYSGKTQYSLLDYIPEGTGYWIAPETQHLYDFSFSHEVHLDNAYVRLSLSHADITVGKQQLSYGTGCAWNPTDIFNRKDVFDPTYEQTGQNAIRLDVPLGRSFSAMVIYAPGEYWNEPTWVGGVQSQIGRFDLSVSALTTLEFRTQPNNYSSYGGQAIDLNRWKLGRDAIGFDFVGQVIGLGLWGEAAYHFTENLWEEKQDYLEAVMGFDYTFRSELYVLGEYYRNNSGRSKKAYDYEEYNINIGYTLDEWVQYLMGEIKTLGRDQAYVFVQYPLTDLILIGGSVIGCINDESMALVPQLTYSLFQDVELTAFGNFYLGDEGTMYSKHLGNGGLARLRVYF